MGGPSFAIIVAFRLKPGEHDRFVELVRENAATSVRVEPGCFRFDVLETQHADEVLLYEIYADAVAFDEHLRSTHFLSFDDATRDIVVTKATTHCSLREYAKK